MDDHTYDESFEQQVDLDFDLICDICASLQDSVPEISSETAERIIKSLKNNRSCDGNGISAEHLKYGGKPVSIFIAQVLNSVFHYGKVPEMFKMGYITPIYKKQGKPLFDPNSYRRITITSLIGKGVRVFTGSGLITGSDRIGPDRARNWPIPLLN